MDTSAIAATVMVVGAVAVCVSTFAWVRAAAKKAPLAGTWHIVASVAQIFFFAAIAETTDGWIRWLAVGVCLLNAFTAIQLVRRRHAESAVR